MASRAPISSQVKTCDTARYSKQECLRYVFGSAALCPFVLRVSLAQRSTMNVSS
jgi:hypothetical protein